jgi:hypothetical protein
MTNPVWADWIETLIDLGELEAPVYLKHYELNAQRSPQDPRRGRCRGLEPERATWGRVQSLSDGMDGHTARSNAPGTAGLGFRTPTGGAEGTSAPALQDALAIFEALGAPLWATGRRELRRISGRRPADAAHRDRAPGRSACAGSLPRDRSVAMGVSTVESRLSHVYRKLGVRRVGLAAWLTSSSGPPATS